MQQVICQHILQWVEENLNSALKITDLAASTGYSRRTLEQWFSAQYGMSPGNYLIRRRMTRAAVLLKMTPLPVTEIALFFHHSSNQNFARAFRRFSGTTPTDYRNNKGWDLSILQASLFYTEEIKTDVTVCYLPEQYLQGISYTNMVPYSYQGNHDAKKPLIDQIRQEVVKLTRAGEKDIYLTGCPVLPENLKNSREGHLIAAVTVGRLCSVKKEDSILMPGGKFCHYHFTCSWEEYYANTDIIFIRIMSENKFYFTGGNCYVHFSGKPTSIEVEVTCDVFIPVK
ncbi:helix-turn-helix transcriptional regulator [Salmonella enterica]|nr:AraC family transcriptional regulator [Salmonella enterica subsp. enterica serovar Freetown]EBN9932555.1 AraC family transcriptional regulator [Salmonella enterica]EBH8792422.1 AraC family transcriptional regulator [Salmonella enterica subsp. enterica serovar Freetown]EBP0843342.1 helix-turn-helix transcriptional regulator [Salmonella enterica]EJS3009929.1 helix-turn-helix transcriptional regulator [Salmonella enterica]